MSASDAPRLIPTAELEPAVGAAFATVFGARPTFLGRAPGRVELLGNHTDYNGGLVMAAAVDRETVVVGRPVAGRTARVHAADFAQTDTFDLDAIEPAAQGHWSNYARGVVKLLQTTHGSATSGFELAILGNVPLGAGLSSSASLQAALAAFLLGSGVIDTQGMPGASDDAARFDLARTLQRSENEFVGVGSGLLDQFSVLFGRQGHALWLDCRSFAFGRVPLGSTPPALVVCDSKTSRRLADGMYNRRRAECETVVSHFAGVKGSESVRSLRDVSLADLEAHWDALDPVGRLRARHVLNENARVLEGVEALTAGDLTRFGALISASHASSRDDFENSSDALNALIEAAAESPGFLGGKLSGAGWAGCTINLVEPAQAEAFAAAVAAGYRQRTGVEAAVHILQAAEGASARAL